MKHVCKAALAFVALAGSTGTAFAIASGTPANVTLSGQTGSFINPTGEIVSKDGPEIVGNYSHASNPYSSSNEYSIQGAIQAADKLELNAGYAHDSYDYGVNTNFWHVGAKYQILNQRDKGLDLAIGGDYGRDTASYGFSTNQYFAYVAATKAFNTNNSRAPIKGTLGLRWDKLSPEYGFTQSKGSVYGGVQVPLTRTGDFSLIGELASKRSEYASSGYSLGALYQPKNTGLSIGVGVAREWYDRFVFAQVGYQFGK